MTALQRVGVKFTEQQKAQVKALVESGDLLKAQALILKELNTEFGGAAAAARNTFGGALRSLGNTIGDAKEEIGFAMTKSKVFVDGIFQLEGAVRKLIPEIENWIKANDSIINE